LPIFEQRRQVLAAIGYELAAARFDPRVPPDVAVQTRVPPGTAHLSANASTPFKEWPVASWAELVRLLLARGTPSVIATGSREPRERHRLEALEGLVRDARFRALSDTPSIPGLARILQQCAIHVGTDSGVTHLAMALGLPTVSLFREYLGLEEWRPRGAAHRALTMPCDCADSARPTAECRAAGIALCLARIPAEDVARAVAELQANPLAPAGIEDPGGEPLTWASRGIRKQGGPGP
jgi:ADP-heptose:LPS heptosyltransferase